MTKAIGWALEPLEANRPAFWTGSRAIEEIQLV